MTQPVADPLPAKLRALEQEMRTSAALVYASAVEPAIGNVTMKWAKCLAAILDGHDGIATQGE